MCDQTIPIEELMNRIIELYESNPEAKITIAHYAGTAGAFAAKPTLDTMYIEPDKNCKRLYEQPPSDNAQQVYTL